MIQYMIFEEPPSPHGNSFIASFVYNGQKEVQSFQHFHLAWEWIQQKLSAECMTNVAYEVKETDEL